MIAWSTDGEGDSKARSRGGDYLLAFGIWNDRRDWCAELAQHGISLLLKTRVKGLISVRSQMSLGNKQPAKDLRCKWARPTNSEVTEVHNCQSLKRVLWAHYALGEAGVHRDSNSKLGRATA